MKVTIPAQEVEKCDVCKNTVKYTTKCAFCGCDFCLSCRAIIAGCAHQVPVCGNCEDNETVLEIVNRHAVVIQTAINARNEELKIVGQAGKEPVDPTPLFKDNPNFEEK